MDDNRITKNLRYNTSSLVFDNLQSVLDFWASASPEIQKHVVCKILNAMKSDQALRSCIGKISGDLSFVSFHADHYNKTTEVAVSNNGFQLTTEGRQDDYTVDYLQSLLKTLKYIEVVNKVGYNS
jgi:hypothetical protein